MIWVIAFHAAGDFFITLYEKYTPTLIRYAQSLTKNQAQAEDAVHEAFLRVYKNIDKLAGRSEREIKGFLIITTQRVCFTFLAKPTEDEFNEDDVMAEDPLMEHLDAFVAKTILIKLLRETRREDRQLLAYRNVHKMAYKEIAHLTGMTESNVSVRLHRLRANLKRKYWEMANG